jgi:hypothetical protein
MSLLSQIPASIAAELHHFLEVCETTLTLATREAQALAGSEEYLPADFGRQRKNLLPNLETALMNLRNQRSLWLNCHPEVREHCDEVKLLFHKIQGILMKLLSLDRENQQAMLRRGLMPAQFVPASATQKPNYVASIYQRHKSR